MRSEYRSTIAGIVTAALTAVGLSIFFVAHLPIAEAALAPAPCAGNICTGTITVGGQAVQYSYTQHLASNGQFRIRFNGGSYATLQMVSFIVYNLPPFASSGYLANPTNGAQPMTETNVNPGFTAYERLDSNGCASCIYDHVMSVQYAALAAGTYSFSFTVVQNGGTGGLVSLPIYVHAGATVNSDESTTWIGAGVPAGMDFPCADNVDNDLDFYGDCADIQCGGRIGKVATGSLCQVAETTCDDQFDNDADGKPDCTDSDCNGRDGLPGAGIINCQYGNETAAGTCGDGFDNDGDGFIDCSDNTFDALAGGSAATICWKKTAFNCPAVENCATGLDDDKDKSYDDSWDAVSGTGVNCQDYDCAGNIACPVKEHKTAAGTDADAQCFDGIDNDLDHLADCADPDCLAMINPSNPTEACTEKEFDLGQRYQFCANGRDDDGDTPIDCADLDCKRRFGSCGPCPEREDFTWAACSDAKDNDSDVAMDCSDIDCLGDLGTLGVSGKGAAYCAAAENTDATCNDGFDNDVDGLIDCDDGQCSGHTGPGGAICQPAGETSCADALDNDGDGLIDCVDSNCAGVSSCAAMSWVQVPSCNLVPSYSGPTAFTGSAPTITAVVALSSHVSDVHTIRLVGAATYSSVTVIVGDNTSAIAYYPYASLAGCTLKDTISGLTAARFKFTVADNHAIQIYNTAGADVSGFDITLSCTTPATPASIKFFPISISALKSPGDVTEFGDVTTFATTLYENTLPIVSEVEAEGMLGANINVRYGGVASPPTRRMRGVPNDPGAGLNTSGICRCEIDVNGTLFNTTSACITNGIQFTSDAALNVKGRAEDGASNIGAYSAVQTYNVNVTPVVSTPLAILPSAPYFRNGDMTVTLSAEFITGGSDFFAPACKIYVRDELGAIVNGPVGPTFSFAGITVANTMNCYSSSTLPSMTDGRHYVTMVATDNDSDSVESNRKAMFMCNSIPGAGDPEPTNGCQYADFDGDGAAEGLYSSLYSTEAKQCDNCVGLANSNQADTNANGVGDQCEPNDTTYGRCEIDTEIVCKYDSNDAGHGCPSGDFCCPGPSLKADLSVDLSPAVPKFQPKNPQLCRADWGLCTLGGDFCFVDSDCPGGQGLCQDDATACFRDIDCAALPGSAACTGADRCENLLYPWLQTSNGNIFSGKRVTAPELPPANQFNATFCITAKDLIVNFVSEGQGNCAAVTDVTSRLELPKSSNAYSTVLGKIDLVGLRAGKFGTVVNVPVGQLDAILTSYAGQLGGRVFRVTGNETLGARTFNNDAIAGAGTILIDGGNLTINGNLTYDTSAVTKLSKLASLGIIVVDDGSGTRGNLYVHKSVTAAVGAVYVGGSDGFYSVAAPDSDSPLSLTWYGLVVARKFHFSRSYKSLTQGSERFIYDGRAVVNPPPGFADLTRALPVLGDTVVP